MDPDTKAGKMKKKTEDMRRMFNLPDTESVIQDYACALRKSVLVPGRMFISQIQTLRAMRCVLHWRLVKLGLPP